MQKGRAAFRRLPRPRLSSSGSMLLEIGLLDPQARKIRPISPEQKNPEKCCEYGELRHRGLHCDVVHHDVCDDGSKERERQNHVAVNQKQNAREQLCRRDQVHVMRREKRTQKLSCHARRQLRRKEAKKSV